MLLQAPPDTECQPTCQREAWLPCCDVDISNPGIKTPKSKQRKVQLQSLNVGGFLIKLDRISVGVQSDQLQVNSNIRVCWYDETHAALPNFVQTEELKVSKRLEERVKT